MEGIKSVKTVKDLIYLLDEYPEDMVVCGGMFNKDTIQMRSLLVFESPDGLGAGNTLEDLCNGKTSLMFLGDNQHD